MPENTPINWKTQIRWENFPQTESVYTEKRKQTTACPRCQEVMLISVDYPNWGKCPGCGLGYNVTCERESEFPEEDTMSVMNKEQSQEIENLNRIKMIASFRQVIGHYVTKKAGLEITAKTIETEAVEVRQRAQELLDAEKEVKGHIRMFDNMIETLHVAVEKLQDEVVEKS